MVRAPCCEKMGLKKGPWTPEEDQILISYIEKYGHGNWRALPKQAGKFILPIFLSVLYIYIYIFSKWVFIYSTFLAVWKERKEKILLDLFDFLVYQNSQVFKRGHL